MQTPQEQQCLTLSIPAEACWTLVVRMALGGAGALMGLDIDLMDDLRTAADETCDFLMHQPRRVKRIQMACHMEQNAVCTVFSCEWAQECQTCEEMDIEVTRGILETLIPQVELEADGVCIRSVSLKLPLPVK